MRILLANPRGFCAGVERAIEIVERALEEHGAPVYVRHEVVHNTFVVNNLKKKGAIFVEDVNEIPNGNIIIFSAHGVSQEVRKQANNISKTIYDATCPLVTKVHKEIVRKQKQQHKVILIGHKGHPEVEGTLGQVTKDRPYLVENIDDIQKLNIKTTKNIFYTTQTTLSVDDTKQIINELKIKFPDIKAPQKNDICYATQNRQDAVKKIMQSCEVLLVLGSKNSSNSNRLKEIALKMEKPAYLIDSSKDIDQSWFKNIKTIGITAGASAPETLVQEVIDYLHNNGAKDVIEVSGIKENTHFPIPKELR